jgi:hypothetical protein
VGGRLFDAWLRVYFSRFRYRIAHGNDLLNLADEIGIGPAVRSAFDQWLRGVSRP